MTFRETERGFKKEGKQTQIGVAAAGNTRDIATVAKITELLLGMTVNTFGFPDLTPRTAVVELPPG